MSIPTAVALWVAPSLLSGAQAPAPQGISEAFAVDLYHVLSPAPGNLMFSPYGLSESLALLSRGAAAKTQEQLLHALHWEGPADTVGEAFKTDDRAIESANGRAAGGGPTVSVANGLWYQQGEAPKAAFLGAARDGFHAAVNAADFVGNSGGAENEINQWVSQKTLGKITDLIPAGGLTARTRLVLANAIYFKGTWESRFKESSTRSAPFFTSSNGAVPVPLMRQTEAFRGLAEQDCDLLEMPYDGGALSMVIVLPRERDGLASLEARLTAHDLFLWLASLDFSTPKDVDLSLPRFRMTYTGALDEALKQLGVTAAFDPDQADFSAINGRPDLHLSHVFHKAFLEVDEQGTEAADATGMIVATLGIRLSPAFKADHPFIFLICDTSSGALLFMGRVVNPKAE